MSELTHLQPLDLGTHPAPDKGPSPQLQWIAIGDLRCDPSYQRQITRQGETNVRKIARAFSWSKFAPVIVAPIEGGVFAIIDGQHRTTAALSIGVKQVPCQVILATRGEQAAAFSAINGTVTRINSLALHRAAVAAGDAEAVRLDGIAARAGVKILAYPVPETKQKPGETMALETLRRALARHGETALVFVLTVLVKSPNLQAGGLAGAIIEAVIDFVAAELTTPEAFSSVAARPVEAFLSARNLVRDLDHVRALGAAKGVTRATQLCNYLTREYDIWKGEQLRPKSGESSANIRKPAALGPTTVAAAMIGRTNAPAVSAKANEPLRSADGLLPAWIGPVQFTDAERRILTMLSEHPQVPRDKLQVLCVPGVSLDATIANMKGRLARLPAQISPVPNGYRLGLDGKMRIRALVEVRAR